jgi:uncharacterized protein
VSATQPATTPRGARITNLDTVRGIATLGILLMNIVYFGLDEAAYFNLDADGSDSVVDWIVGGLGEIFVDQKMMAIFSLLFGAGIVLFADRAEVKGGRPVVLSMWRNLLLLGIGLLHALLYEGDVLRVYAICAPILLLLRKRSPRTLAVGGTLLVVSSALLGFAVAPTISESGEELGEFWFAGVESMADGPGLWLLWDFASRSLGLMMIGVAMFRSGIVQGTGPAETDRRLIRWGFGLGLPLAIASLLMITLTDFDPQWALPAHGLNTLATIPMALGYIGAITHWNRRPETAMHRRFRAVGRMALTNYLMQSVLGIAIVAVVLPADSGRFVLLGVVFVIWALQLAWSQPWLERFTMGPAEWLWRLATYRRVSPIRR